MSTLLPADTSFHSTAASRRFNNAGEKSAAVLPPVAPHVCREDVRVCANRRGEVYKITWRH